MSGPAPGTFRNNPAAVDRGRASTISVIVPVHNAERELNLCLAALLEQRSEWLECIVVDDASIDGSAAVANAYRVGLVRLPERRGPAFARNAGARAARGDILFFLDSDCKLHAGVLSAVRVLLDTTPDVAGVFGSYDDETSPSLVSTYKNLTHHWVHQHSSREATTFWSACGAIRREVFMKMGGFDSSAYPKPSIEDVELGYRLHASGFRIRLEPNIQVTHLKRWRLLPLLKCEIFSRGVPWSVLMLRHRRLPRDLNFRPAHRASAVAAWLLPFGAGLSVLSPWFLAPTATLLGLFVMVNGAYLRFLAKVRGLKLALLAIPMQVLFYWCSGLALALGTGAFVLHRTRGREPRSQPGAMQEAWGGLHRSPTAAAGSN